MTPRAAAVPFNAAPWRVRVRYQALAGKGLVMLGLAHVRLTPGEERFVLAVRPTQGSGIGLSGLPLHVHRLRGAHVIRAAIKEALRRSQPDLFDGISAVARRAVDRRAR